VRSAPNAGYIYYADGVNYKRYNPSLNTMEAWAAAAGALPVDPASNTPRLICTWRGRTVLSGLPRDGRNWFMSAVGDPTDFDYAPVSPSSADAVAGNNGPLGLIGDTVTALIPYRDDVLIVGADRTIYQFSGDPLDGGQIDLVSDSIGIAWGDAWCKDPMGVLYFMSNLQGVYRLEPGQKPQRISQAIERLLRDIRLSEVLVRMQWDDLFQGFHLFITPTANAQATTHYFYEIRAGAWWQQEFGNNDHNPLCCHVFNGNGFADTVALGRLQRRRRRTTGRRLRAVW
jgi:hypothetical protein